jgi:hypothetical protein
VDCSGEVGFEVGEAIDDLEAPECVIVDALYVREWTSVSPKQEIENGENNSCDTPRRVTNDSGQ